MAKREIPEINAGSMADIAFLLLIFFLVTTTMDKDKAYIRKIPKKVDVPIPPPPIMDREIFEIQANGQNQLMVRGEIVANPDDISDLVMEFYQTNEKLSPAETQRAYSDPNSPGFKFPFYNFYTMGDIQSQMKAAQDEAERIEETPGADPNVVDFMYSKVDEWKKKERAHRLYGRNVLPEISGQSHIRVVVQSKTGYQLFAKIQSEIEEAIFQLRNEAAERIWGEGYGKIITKLGSDPNDTEYKDKKELLKLLYPDRIIEVTPKN